MSSQHEANHLIGEAGIRLEDGRDFVFRPTFLRISKLGEPGEILDLFEQIQTPGDDGRAAAYLILTTLCDTDCDILVDHYEFDDSGKRILVQGIADQANLHIIAAALLIDGIIGRPTPFEKKKSSSSEVAKEFDASDFVAIGEAHFPGRDWWNCTMVQLQKAIRAKNGPSEEEKNFMPAAEIEALYERVGVNGRN